MKLFVKQDGGFRLLGEGTIHDKNSLFLKEANGSLATTTTNVSTGAAEAQKEMNKTPSLGGVDADPEKLDGNSTDNGTVVNVDTRSQESQKEAQRMLNTADSNSKMSVHYYDGNKTNPDGSSLGESKIFTKRLIEMKKNAVPFTKRELNKYFRNM